MGNEGAGRVSHCLSPLQLSDFSGEFGLDPDCRRGEADLRKSLVGSGDRSERIRTYNFPQGRLTDHRINLTLYKLTDILSGNLDEVINALATEFQAEQLANLND